MDEIQRALGRIESDVKYLVEARKGDDARITALEKKHWFTMGASVALSWLGVHFFKG